MGAIPTIETSEHANTTGTKVGRFLTRRGVLMLKEAKTIGRIKDDFGTS